eukprot:sb/3476493/
MFFCAAWSEVSCIVLTQPRFNSPLNRHKKATNQNTLFRSRDWLSANQGPVYFLIWCHGEKGRFLHTGGRTSEDLTSEGERGKDGYMPKSRKIDAQTPFVSIPHLGGSSVYNICCRD